MHELEAKVKPICSMMEKLTEWSKCELDKGKDCVDTKEMGEVIDMIKDLAEAEEKCIKAAYYKTIAKAMKEEEMGRMGYDNWRTSSGRFANKGTGMYRPEQSGRRGYPMPAEGDWRPEYGPWGDMDTYNQMMGYDGGSSGGRGSSQSSSSGSGRNSNRGGRSDGSSTSSMDGGRMGYTDPDYERIMRDERHGRPYREWQLSRRHYTETKSEGDKKEMSQHAKEHMSDMVMSVKEMWSDADPELKTKMKADLTALMNEMK